eukprot:COSAG01_NODE_67906_length_265_cov_1.548193_1_plen_27_part_10
MAIQDLLSRVARTTVYTHYNIYDGFIC